MCHQVQDDTIASYNASSHSQVSCLACHEPVNGSPVSFIMAKLRSATELVPAMTRTFELPLNKGSALALSRQEMGDDHCLQCHSTNRLVTASPGIIINHEVHTKAGITCTTCHNRIAHSETGITLTLPGNAKHADFMKMGACFRCHDLSGAKKAPGTCRTCHTPEFKLTPASHLAPDWRRSGHGAAASEVAVQMGVGEVEAEELVREGIAPSLADPVNSCKTCHLASFCDDCHARLKPGSPN